MRVTLYKIYEFQLKWFRLIILSAFSITFIVELSLISYNYYELQVLLDEASEISLIDRKIDNYKAVSFFENSKNRSKVYFDWYINEVDLEDIKSMQRFTFIIDNSSITQGAFYFGVEWQVNKNSDELFNGIKYYVINYERKVFKIKIKSKFYILKRLDLSKNENDLLAAHVKSKNIVIILGAFDRKINNKDEYTWYISEFLDLKLNDDRILNGDINVLRNIAIDLLNALKDIHSKNILHLDIFPRNIGGKIDENGNIVFKLFDFGLGLKMKLKNYTDIHSKIDINDVGNIIKDLSSEMKKVKKDRSNMKSSLEDFILILTYNVEFPISSVEEALSHPFISGKPYYNVPDKYGKRKLPK